MILKHHVVGSARVTLGRNVRMYRSARHLTQKRLSEITGLDRSFISELECAKVSATVDVVDRIAGVFDLPAMVLLFSKDTPEPKNQKAGRKRL